MSKKLIQAAAGAAGGESVYVDDVFSTYLYGAEGTNPTIQTGIDMSEDGGMVWIKNRDAAEFPSIVDTERTDGSLASWLATSSTDVQSSGYGTGVSATFPTNGFTLSGTRDNLYNNSADFVSWNFKRQAGFFDVITYTGDGSGDRNISHSLSSTPACIILKKTSTTSDWPVYHIGAGTGAFDALALNQTSATGGLLNYILSTSSTDFEVRSSYNDSGVEYVAYLFAHDDQSFGDNADESIIKCGSYTETGSDVSVNLGFEPQWLMLKRSDGVSHWFMYDTMRGLTWSDGSNAYLQANTSNAEDTQNAYFKPTPTGFIAESYLGSGATWVYIAIRRPMKTPEAGTDVFATDTQYSTSPNPPKVHAGFPVDMVIDTNVAGGVDRAVYDRMRGAKKLSTNNTNAESSNPVAEFDFQDGYDSETGLSANTNVRSWMFKRATGFMDVVAYTGDGSPSNTVRRDLNHNLGVTPELAILKRRDSTSEWQVGVNGTSLYLNLSNGSAGTYTHSSYFNATDFDVEGWVTEANNNVSGATYVVYLFATLAGVSKVGSYTGTGSALTIDCGFSSGARFIMIKRTDAAAGWIVFDSERGIVAGADPYIYLNATDAESSTDAIDPDSSGFIVNPVGGALNTSGGEYIFLAIA